MDVRELASFLSGGGTYDGHGARAMSPAANKSRKKAKITPADDMAAEEQAVPDTPADAPAAATA